MPDVSLNLDPSGGLWPVMPVAASTPEDEPAVDFGALILMVQGQAHLEAAPLAIVPAINPVTPLVPPPAEPVVTRPMDRETHAINADVIEVIELEPTPIDLIPEKVPVDPVDGDVDVDVDVEAAVDDAPAVVPNPVMQTMPQPAPQADVAQKAGYTLAPAPAPAPATAPAATSAPTPAATSAPVTAPVTAPVPVPAAAPTTVATPESAPESATVPVPALAATPVAAPAPAVAPPPSTPATPSSLDVSTWSVIPQKRQATQPSVDRVDRVDQASVARVVPAPRQAPTVTAPRAATGSEIPPVIVPALPVEPDAPSHSPIESQVARPADARIDSPLRPHIDVKTDAPPVTMTPGPAATTTPAPVAEAASAPPPATPAPVQSMAPTAEDGTPVMPRLVEMMRWQAQEGGGQAQLRLRPELLGAVTVSIVVEHGAVKAIVSAETPAALEYLRAESSGLQEALEERGLTLDEFEVREESPLAERRRDPDDAPPRKETAPPAPRRRPADADGEAVFNVLM